MKGDRHTLFRRDGAAPARHGAAPAAASPSKPCSAAARIRNGTIRLSRAGQTIRDRAVVEPDRSGATAWRHPAPQCARCRKRSMGCYRPEGPVRRAHVRLRQSLSQSERIDRQRSHRVQSPRRPARTLRRTGCQAPVPLDRGVLRPVPGLGILPGWKPRIRPHARRVGNRPRGERTDPSLRSPECGSATPSGTDRSTIRPRTSSAR